MFVLCHSLLRLGWFTDTAISGSIAARCIADFALSVNLPMRLLSKGESSDETRVSRRWFKSSSGRSHFIEHFARFGILAGPAKSKSWQLGQTPHRAGPFPRYS